MRVQARPKPRPWRPGPTPPPRPPQVTALRSICAFLDRKGAHTGCAGPTTAPTTQVNTCAAERESAQSAGQGPARRSRARPWTLRTDRPDHRADHAGQRHAQAMRTGRTTISQCASDEARRPRAVAQTAHRPSPARAGARMTGRVCAVDAAAYAPPSSPIAQPNVGQPPGPGDAAPPLRAPAGGRGQGDAGVTAGRVCFQPGRRHRSTVSASC